MDANRFTQKVQEAVQAAQSIAVRYGNQQLDAEHLLSALLAQDGGLATSILNKAEVNVPALTRRLDQEIDRLPKVSGPMGTPDQIYITPRLQQLFVRAEDEAKRLKDEYVSVEHLLLAMTEDGGAAGRSPQRIQRHPRPPDARHAGGARQPARHLTESRSHL